MEETIPVHQLQILQFPILNASNAGVYNCLVTGLCDSQNSGLAGITVLPTTVITLQPLHQAVDEGISRNFYNKCKRK